ncbi:glycosyltransferase family 2 protein [Salinibacterium hongtaonis]|uniref:glycosyltransferase family 2 protein n=1 Tax=Homoserinimonas hongtaonis TaxID=2079791 RepID=UPI000D3C1D11|nr:glycosyltransferase family 2 protein [Salinibacterium hongtaonis]AWB88649.1 glycosyltransferase family 2 protein [Salinibacterium hongtaonis]
MTTISVALCTYNGARYIEEQLRSIVSQSVAPSEIIISDDGSTDSTLDVIRGFLQEYDTGSTAITILGGAANVGVTANFQRAIEASSGDLVVLCDQDDVWHVNRIEKAISSFDSRPALLLQHSDARLIDDEGEPLGLSLLDALSASREERAAINGPRPLGAFIRRNLATGATVAFRRSLLEWALPFPSNWVHDEWLAVIAAALGEVELLDAELVDYRQHGNNQIGVRKPTLRYRLGRMLEPRGTRYVTLASRSATLADRLETLPVDDYALELARNRARFDAMRATLSPHRVCRLRTVLREYRAGSYAALASQGNLDVARDLLQPA